jgi:hypothetical protein
MKVDRNPPTTIYDWTAKIRMKYEAQMFMPERALNTLQPPVNRVEPLMILESKPKKVKIL